MSKNAAQILEQVLEIAREAETYASYKSKLLHSVKELEGDYSEKRIKYLDYERKLSTILDGKTKSGWLEYYNSCIYSLLKKIELLLSETSALVYDDASMMQVTAAQAAPKASAAEKKIEVFNVDNEIAKLQAILRSGELSAQEVQAIKKELSPKVPQFQAIKQEIEKAEAARQQAIDARARELARVAETKLKTSPAIKQAAAETKKQPSMPKIKMPKLHIKLINPFRIVHSIALRLTELLNIAEARVKHRNAKAAKEPALQPVQAGDVLSFPELVQYGEAGKARKQQEKPQSLIEKLKHPFSRKEKGIFVEEIVAMERAARTQERREAPAEAAGIAFGWFNPKRLLAEFTGHFREKQEPILGEKTAVPVHMKKLRSMRKQLYEEEKLAGFDSTLLAQEAKRVKHILEIEKAQVYRGSSLGLIANVTVRRISLFLVNNFPQFFGYLYNALRAANVKVLSNTYLNIMILITMVVTAFSFFMLLMVFFILSHPLYQVVLRSIIFSLIAGLLCATIFYLYPFLMIKERRRKTTTNLPFAINHMAAVATSGVPPAQMFELIANSGEYSEVGVEVKKVVDFINIFGYDLLTAIKVVASTTPSIPFKKFLEGMVNTIETGGDLDKYLSQEADEAALTYKLERQRYNETVSTYSDIYTGVLIAAPLFFVAALAMVNLLGGTLGGLGVGFVMAMGAYVVIPLINILFIIFLQLTQPEA